MTKNTFGKFTEKVVKNVPTTAGLTLGVIDGLVIGGLIAGKKVVIDGEEFDSDLAMDSIKKGMMIKGLIGGVSLVVGAALETHLESKQEKGVLVDIDLSNVKETNSEEKEEA